MNTDSHIALLLVAMIGSHLASCLRRRAILVDNGASVDVILGRIIGRDRADVQRRK